MLLKLEPARDISSIDDCYFYHCVNLPGHGEVKAEWDLRGVESDNFGSLNFHNKKVLEVGSASGYLTFWLEDQGADVLAFDLSEKQDWDAVPFAKSDFKAIIEARREHIRKLNNAWWYSHKLLGKKAKKMYGSVYDLSQDVGHFNVVTLCNILLHLRDPFLAMQKAASLAEEYLIITELAKPFSLWDEPVIEAAEGQNFCQFLPKHAKQEPWDTWWYLPENTLIEMLKILGFDAIEVRHFWPKFRDGNRYEFTSIVGKRST
jgi:2-polyprenyl-3-methyl-5-hydroxy-6-metoxy-1,4-benzoquinol methylase